MGQFRSCVQGSFDVAVITELALHMLQVLLHLGNLLRHMGLLLLQQVQDIVDVRRLVALIAEKFLELCDGHAGPLKAEDRPQTVDVLLLIDTLAAFRALDIGEDSHVLVITQGGSGEVKHLRDLLDGIGFHMFVYGWHGNFPRSRMLLS